MPLVAVGTWRLWQEDGAKKWERMIGDGSEAAALSAEVEELVYGFGRVHSLYFLGASIKEGVGQRLSFRKSTESLGQLNALARLY